MARCGPLPWPVYGFRALRTPCKMAPVGAAPGASRSSTAEGCTSYARTRSRPRALALDDAQGTSHPESALCIQDACTVAAASWPWAITSRQNKKPAPNRNPNRDAITAQAQGTGTRQYSRCFRRHSVCRKQRGFLPSFRASTGGLLPRHSVGK